MVTKAAHPQNCRPRTNPGDSICASRVCAGAHERVVDAHAGAHDRPAKRITHHPVHAAEPLRSRYSGYSQQQYTVRASQYARERAEVVSWSVRRVTHRRIREEAGSQWYNAPVKWIRQENSAQPWPTLYRIRRGPRRAGASFSSYSDLYGVTVAVRVAPAYASQTATKIYQVPAWGSVTVHDSSLPASNEWQPGSSSPETSGGTAR
jgi:hypothetical protein